MLWLLTAVLAAPKDRSPGQSSHMRWKLQAERMARSAKRKELIGRLKS